MKTPIAVIAPLDKAAYERYQAALKGIRIPPPKLDDNLVALGDAIIGTDDFALSITEIMRGE